ncbi:restriction endonuclease subunit S [Metamycoplasma hyosynoviae]|uniref:restriction endonuclease subunit S n=1 Tax=Metamycoplasma hyosynoviae TaxID=29559 RepID=UPI00235A2B41|nr:restriction endonuclease subunit S [Metamycoplasma hyosynoviae]MDC8917926.1 restriction endonuclease subunit S [Metamycoplasma hyosynoviae]
MPENKTKPEIRFKGFTYAWELSALGDIFKYEQPLEYIVKSTKYDDKNKIPVLTAGQSFILGYTNEEFGIKDASERNPVIIFDDFTTSSHYVDFPFKVKSSAMKLLTLSNINHNIHCTYNILKNINYVPVSHERHWISIFSKFDVLLPKEPKEQQKIGNFFKNLDKIIDLHQRKCEKLQTIKKSLLSKMFPSDDKSIPEIRFNGYTYAWELSALGDIFKYEQPLEYIVKSTKYDDKNKIPVLTAGQSFILGYTNEEFGIKDASERNPVIIFDDFTTSSHYVDFPFKVKSSAMKLLTLSNINHNIHCTYNILKNINYVPVSHERHWISIFSKFDVLLPKEPKEQQKIGNFFKNLDKIIDLHQCKCEKLQTIKKSLLGKMFC